jgi:alkanesulfonate monooxygenase SsuD/methylene tetrahydromethanopterin reductase-like flavin-dependent oxidoreductase (luciferase family)
MAFQLLPAGPPLQRFAETVKQVGLARDLGFDPVVFGQHFLAGEFAMLQPAVATARLAAPREEVPGLRRVGAAPGTPGRR